jgi:hypothetical protein
MMRLAQIEQNKYPYSSLDRLIFPLFFLLLPYIAKQTMLGVTGSDLSGFFRQPCQ